jgi:hypothetical protein
MKGKDMKPDMKKALLLFRRDAFQCLIGIAIGLIIAALFHDCTEYTNIATERETSMETAIREDGGQRPEAPSFDDLLDAIEWVESKGDADAVGDNGRAVGAYQLHKIYVDEVNRLLGNETYSYEDRWDKAKSRQMTHIYLLYHAFTAQTELRLLEYKGSFGRFEILARIHNGGPQGYKKESTKAYWLKVKERMEK